MEELKEILAKAGFLEIEIFHKEQSDEIIRSWNFGDGVERMVFSAYIKARKPGGDGGRIMVDEWITEVKKKSDFQDLGMILVHNGVVRATSKDGKSIKRMRLSHDKGRLHALIEEFSKKEGIVSVKAWINEGMLTVGDDIMYALVAGRFRTIVIPVLEEFVGKIKKEVVTEEEFF
ncbi:MAG: molybdenum cofactor biosynthesis protein MoaE [Nitrospirota bacterium]